MPKRNKASTPACKPSTARLYSQHCAGCHGDKLEGKGNVPALPGEAFLKRCADSGHTVDDVFYIIRAFMPYNEPGKLSNQQYVEILAYVLKVNGLAAGATALFSDASVIQRLAFGRHQALAGCHGYRCSNHPPRGE
ncbi:MAG: c-type cytochrome [Burkholderiales bacterium]